MDIPDSPQQGRVHTRTHARAHTLSSRRRRPVQFPADTGERGGVAVERSRGKLRTHFREDSHVSLQLSPPQNPGRSRENLGPRVRGWAAADGEAAEASSGWGEAHCRRPRASGCSSGLLHTESPCSGPVGHSGGDTTEAGVSWCCSPAQMVLGLEAGPQSQRVPCPAL